MSCSACGSPWHGADWCPSKVDRYAEAGAYWLGYLGLVLGPVAATERAVRITWERSNDYGICYARQISERLRGQR